MTFISRAARYVLRKRVRTAVLFIVLTIITASMLSATAVSQAAQHEAGQIEKQAVSGFVLASNLQGSMLTPRGGGMVRPADVQRISKLSGVGSCMVRQNATADLVGASVVKVPGGDDYDAEKEQQFGNTANVIGTNDSSKLNVFTSHTLGMVEGRHLKASDKHMSMVHEDLAKTNGLKVGDTLTLKANPYDADNESHSTATVKTTIVGIFKGDSDRKVSSRAELTSNTVYTDLDTTSTLYQYKVGKEIYQDATFVLDRGVDVEKTMEAAKKLPVDWNNYQITRNDQYTSSMLNAARSVRSMMRGALIGVTISAVIPQPHALAVDERPTSGDGRIGVPRHRQAIPDRPISNRDDSDRPAVPGPRMAVRTGSGPMAWHLGPPFRERLRGEGTEQHGTGRRRS